MATLDKAHQECEKHAAASKGEEFSKMRAHGMKAYPDVCRNTDVPKAIPGGIVGGFKSNTKLDVEQDTYEAHPCVGQPPQPPPQAQAQLWQHRSV